MHKLIPYLFLIVLTGCATAGSLPQLSGSETAASIKGKGDFVEMNDGSFVEGTISDIGFNSVTINGKKISGKDIRAFQHDSKYKTKFRTYFVTRVIKGNITLYSRTIDHSPDPMTSRGGGRVIHYFLQKGDGKIMYFDLATLRTMVKDYAPALQWVEEYKKLKKKDDSYLDKAIETYNLK